MPLGLTPEEYELRNQANQKHRHRWFGRLRFWSRNDVSRRPRRRNIFI